MLVQPPGLVTKSEPPSPPVMLEFYQGRFIVIHVTRVQNIPDSATMFPINSALQRRQSVDGACATASERDRMRKFAIARLRIARQLDPQHAFQATAIKLSKVKSLQDFYAGLNEIMLFESELRNRLLIKASDCFTRLADDDRPKALTRYISCFTLPLTEDHKNMFAALSQGQEAYENLLTELAKEGRHCRQLTDLLGINDQKLIEQIELASVNGPAGEAVLKGKNYRKVMREFGLVTSKARMALETLSDTRPLSQDRHGRIKMRSISPAQRQIIQGAKRELVWMKELMRHAARPT